MIDKNELPPGWAIAKFEDLLDYIQPTEYIVASTEYDDKYKTPVLTAGKSFIKGYTNETNGIFDALPVIIFDDFTTAIQFVNFPFKVKSSAMKILKPTSDLVNIKLAFYFMKTVHLKSETHKRYWISEYSKLLIPLPPHNEQKKIFDKIEEHFIILDKGIESLRTAQKQLKVYRQAVLKWAFEGKLTNKNVVDGELPKGWCWKTIEDVADIATGVTPLRTDKSFWENGTIPWITSGALNDTFVYKAEEFVTQKAFDETTLKLLPKHTLLLALYGEGKTRGKCSELMFESTTNQAIAGIKLKKEFEESRNFLKWFLLKNYQDIRLLSAGGVQPNLNSTIVKKTPFPFPSPTEQKKIIQEIESRLSVCDKIEEAIETSLLQAEALRLSIIKKGFEGKLVKQNPKDESAEILLAKIRAEIKKNSPEKPEKKVKIKTSKKKKELA